MVVVPVRLVAAELLTLSPTPASWPIVTVFISVAAQVPPRSTPSATVLLPFRKSVSRTALPALQTTSAAAVPLPLIENPRRAVPLFRMTASVAPPKAMT